MCRKVRIRRCDIVAGDDCIVLKTTEKEPCEDVVVTGCVLESAASAIKLGTESHGDFRNIRFKDCKIRNSFTGIGFYLKDGGTIRNVRFENISIENCPMTVRTVTPIFMDIERRHKDSRVGAIRDVIFENIDIKSGSGVLIQGMPGSPIRDLVLKNVGVRVDKADDFSRRNKPIGGRRTLKQQRDHEFARLPAYVTLAHVSGLRVEDLVVRVSREDMKKYDRSAMCGRFLESGVLCRVRREGGDDAGERPVIDLKDCKGVDIVTKVQNK
jgi:hypothetical protein